MNRIGVLSVQIDRALRASFVAAKKKMETELRRPVRESEVARVLLRQAVATGGSLRASGYEEGHRAGMAAAKEEFERGVDAARSGRGPRAPAVV